jgi:xanthine dehydrogenase molybdopterin-binding subunit B
VQVVLSAILLLYNPVSDKGFDRNVNTTVTQHAPNSYVVLYFEWSISCMTHTSDQATRYTVVGNPTRRIDAEDKITGRTRFTGDMVFPGMVYARLVLSPYAHARIVSIDTSVAEALPGVVAVYTAQTLQMAKANGNARVQSPLAQDEVFWCGHPVAIVLGESEAAAEDGVVAVDVDYDVLPVVIDPIAAMHPDSPLLVAIRMPLWVVAQSLSKTRIFH